VSVAGQRRPRVTIATRVYHPEPAAAAFRLKALAHALDEAGAEVTVLTGRLAGVDARLVDAGVTVRRAPVLRDSAGLVRGYVQYLSFDVPLFFRLLTGRRPDVVVAEPPPTTGVVVRLACALRRIPYVYYAADVLSDAVVATGAPSFVARAVALLESWALSGAAHVVAVTDGVEERVRELGARRTTVVRNGVDTTTFTPAGPRHAEAPGGPYAVYAGTMSEWQGADVFVRAFAKVRASVPDATLVFLGQGSARDEIEQEARSLPDGGAYVRMLPTVPAAEASAWLRGARATLVSLRPGLGYDFAFPTKVYAGLASGTPVLYAGPGIAAEVIAADGLGLAVEHDADQVADALAGLLRDEPAPEERSRLAAWTAENASQRTRARTVAEVVLGVSR
jgi:glycosyltransferase involved in cell wall biosynthesis